MKKILKFYRYSVFVDEMPYKQYRTKSGADGFVKKLSEADKKRAKVVGIGSKVL